MIIVTAGVLALDYLIKAADASARVEAWCDFWIDVCARHRGPTP